MDGLAALLGEIRVRTGLQEKTPGVFYRRSKAFLHFHEDPAGPFADLACGAGWERFRVNTNAEGATLLQAIYRALAGGA